MQTILQTTSSDPLRNVLLSRSFQITSRYYYEFIHKALKASQQQTAQPTPIKPNRGNEFKIDSHSTSQRGVFTEHYQACSAQQMVIENFFHESFTFLVIFERFWI